MGLIRKTVSVGTLGIVSFRSKKEQLRRAERARSEAERALEREQSSREQAEARIAAAEKRVKQATSHAAHVAKRLEQERRRRRKHRAEDLGELLSVAEPIVRTGVDTLREARATASKHGAKVSRRARRAARRSGRDARKTAERTLQKAKAAAGSGREALAPHAERVAARATETLGQLKK